MLVPQIQSCTCIVTSRPGAGGSLRRAKCDYSHQLETWNLEHSFLELRLDDDDDGGDDDNAADDDNADNVNDGDENDSNNKKKLMKKK